MEKIRDINLRFDKDGINGNEYFLYDFNSLKDYFGMITDITNLGLSNATKFEKVGNRFILINSKSEAVNLTFNINFKSYEKYREFIKRCCWSKNYITVNYAIPIEGKLKSFRRDYYLKSIGKTEKKVGILICPVVLQPISFWYELEKINIQANAGQWATIKINNSSDLDSEIYFETSGRFTNLLFQIIDTENDNIKQMNLKYEDIYNCSNLKFKYSSVDNDSYIKAVGLRPDLSVIDEDLMTLEHVDFADENIFKIPAGKNVIMRFKFDEIVTAPQDIQIKIRKYLISV